MEEEFKCGGKTSFKCISHSEDQNWLLVELEDLDKKEKFWVGNIYGPTIHGEKGEFWDSLETQREGKRWAEYIIEGHFNVTISTEQRRGGTNVRDPIGERLEDFIISWNLIDIKLKKGKFMWNNNRVGP